MSSPAAPISGCKPNKKNPLAHDGDRLAFVIKSKQYYYEIHEWGNIMKKISTCLLALLLLVASISVTQAAGLNELTETKVQLEDSLDADGFAAAYNKVSAYPTQPV